MTLLFTSKAIRFDCTVPGIGDTESSRSR